MEKSFKEKSPEEEIAETLAKYRALRDALAEQGLADAEKASRYIEILGKDFNELLTEEEEEEFYRLGRELHHYLNN